MAPSVESAMAISPAVMVIFIVFGGLYVVNTPSYLRWVPKVIGASLKCNELNMVDKFLSLEYSA